MTENGPEWLKEFYENLDVLRIGLDDEDVGWLERAVPFGVSVETLRLSDPGEVLRLLRARAGSMSVPGSADPWVLLDQLYWASWTLSAAFPTAACLTTTATAFLLAMEEGISVDLVIGVGATLEGSFGSHSWLEYQGAVLFDPPAVRDAYRGALRITAGGLG